MAEEHEFQAQAAEGHRLCANNCGFFGSPATLNLCSKCYRDFHLKEEQASSAKSAVEKSLSAASSSSMVALARPSEILAEITGDHWSLGTAAADLLTPEAQAPATTAQPNRCSVCRRRVGLTGFRCRCGTTFCGTHRYPEQHGCSFDFRAVGKEAIARANPVVKAEKLEKI